MIKLKSQITKELFKETTESIFKFNTLAGNADENGTIEPSKLADLMRLYRSLIAEELAELDDAVLKKDDVAFLDAVGDTIVVATFYDYLGNYGYGVSNFAEYINTVGKNDFAGVCDEVCIEEWLQEFHSRAKCGDIVALWVLAMELDVYWGFMQEICESNMSKFERCFTDECAEEHVQDLTEDYGEAVRCEQIELGGGYYTRFVRERDGKVLKGPWFKEPDLEMFLPED